MDLRACPGAHIGKSMVWLTAASLAAIFKWSEPLDDSGKKLDQSENFETSLL